MSTDSDDAAGNYATQDAPYLQYLRAIEHDWQEAEVLARHLETAAECLPARSHELNLEGYSTSIAQIIDISVSSDDQGNSSNTATLTADLGRHLVRPPPGAVGRFLRKLRSCKPDVHTRVVVLYRPWGTDIDKAADTLLFCHVLGMELDLRPSDVSTLARLEGLRERAVSLRRHPQCAAFISLGSMEDDHNSSVAAWLGVRSFQGVQVNLVVMCLQERRFAWNGSAYPRSDKIWEPPLPSLGIPDKNKRSRLSAAHANRLFTHTLNCSLRAVPLLQTNIADGCWLAALINLETINCAGWLDYINIQWSSVCHDTDPKKQQELAKQTSDLCKTLQSDVSQIIALRRTPGVRVRCSDYEEGLLMLKRLLGEARVIAADAKESLEMQHRIKNMQVSELAINESRSAIAVTVLAFVFIPINLASSVYGMNVQEINETGHSIWGFLVTASVLLTMSGLAWMGWRASRNWSLILDEAGRALPATHRTRWQASTLYSRMQFASERFKRGDFAVYVGLRSVEKRKGSEV